MITYLCFSISQIRDKHGKSAYQLALALDSAVISSGVVDKMPRIASKFIDYRKKLPSQIDSCFAELLFPGGAQLPLFDEHNSQIESAGPSSSSSNYGDQEMKVMESQTMFLFFSNSFAKAIVLFIFTIHRNCIHSRLVVMQKELQNASGTILFSVCFYWTFDLISPLF